MRYPAAEKLEIIRLVEQSRLPVRRTLDKDRVPRSGVRALRSTRLPAGRAGTFRLPRWAA